MQQGVALFLLAHHALNLGQLALDLVLASGSSGALRHGGRGGLHPVAGSFCGCPVLFVLVVVLLGPVQHVLGKVEGDLVARAD
uniref:Uncharacterized protein n=1 Tax=Ixodes ricinus TaxID=34613 RepID=A0A147BB56_IXORI